MSHSNSCGDVVPVCEMIQLRCTRVRKKKDIVNGYLSGFKEIHTSLVNLNPDMKMDSLFPSPNIFLYIRVYHSVLVSTFSISTFSEDIKGDLGTGKAMVFLRSQLVIMDMAGKFLLAELGAEFLQHGWDPGKNQRDLP